MTQPDSQIFLTAQEQSSDFSYGAILLGSCDKSYAMKNEHSQDFYQPLLRLKPDNLSEARWARDAGVSRSFFQDLKKGARPRSDNLEKILGVIGLTPVQFYAMTGQTAEAVAPSNVAEAPSHLYRQRSVDRDVPVFGTGEGGEVAFDNEGAEVAVESAYMMPDDVIDYIRRPIGITEKRQVYALFLVGHSMEPRYMDGEPVFVDPNRNPMIDDHVVIQLRAPDEENGERIVRVLVKRLVRRTADFVELQQYNPNCTFRIAKAAVGAMHRIIPPSELFGI